MKKARIRRCDIYIPHLNYTVRVRTFSGEAPIQNADAYIEQSSNCSCTVYFKPLASHHLISHEITHILRYLCQDRSMTFTDESEHMAYLAQYLMLRITGGNYTKP